MPANFPSATPMPVAFVNILAPGLACLAVLACFATPSPAPAQTAMAGPAAHVPPEETLQLDRSQRAEVEAALRAMPSEALYLSYARIHAAFRAHIGRDDLRLARALIDYAVLAEAEMRARSMPHPESTETAGEMLRLYELVL